MLTGIGGQGVQLAAQVLARAATIEGRGVSLFGVYGGMMRGGNSDSSLVVADGAVSAPPLLSRAWSAILLHHKFWQPMAPKLCAGGVVVVNSSLFEDPLDRERMQVFDVAATDMATELGNAMVTSMVITGAYIAITGLVGLESAVAGMTEAIPPYRRQHIEANERALRTGFASVPASSVRAAPAWVGVAA
jgi:Pyruvate/2-oxoacid:ferredoxin oxidoreductase gamma subunit